MIIVTTMTIRGAKYIIQLPEQEQEHSNIKFGVYIFGKIKTNKKSTCGCNMIFT